MYSWWDDCSPETQQRLIEAMIKEIEHYLRKYAPFSVWLVEHGR